MEPMSERVLLINPPAIDGIKFTRQGRCQEREEVLGTTKPPYTLVVIAALLRARGIACRVIDQTASNIPTAATPSDADLSFTSSALAGPGVANQIVPDLNLDGAADVALGQPPGAEL